MRILNEGPITNKISEIQDYDFHDGFIQYKSLVILDTTHVDERPFKNIVRLLARNASSNGKEFPITIGEEEKAQIKKRFMVCNSKGLPLKGNDYSTGYFDTIGEVINAMKDKLNESLKDKIRTALKEDSIARKTTRWDPDTQPNIYQLDIFLRKSGYRLVDVVDNEGKPEPIIESMKEDHLHPDITYSVADQTFYTEVKKYGELGLSDLEEIIKGYQTALGVVKHLEDLDLFKLEYREESEDEE